MLVRVFSRPQLSLGALLLVGLMILAGCGGRAATPEPPATSTLIPTLAAPTTTTVPAEPTAAPTDTPVTPTAEVTPTTEAIATESITATEAVTVTAEAPASEASTATAEITSTETVTTNAAITATEEPGASAEVTATATTAPEHDMTAGHTMTTTVDVTGTSSMTATASVSPTADTRVFFLQPTTNAVVPITFTVVMSYTGLTLAPAAEEVAGAGHMHILIDTDFIPAGEAIPNDETHLHFGNGATTAELSLTPGSHYLRLQFADNHHIALAGDQYRQEIIVNVVDGAPAQAVRIASPTNGATVPPTFDVVMAAAGMAVEPAGAVVENAGHFHLLLDKPFVAAGEVIPNDETHLHFGKAQLTASLTLDPGPHTIRLQFADGAHHALAGDQYRAEIQVVVAEDAPAAQVMFVKPADNATVTSPFVVAWAASGLIIEPAGAVLRPEGGHLHVLVDADFIPAGEPIPNDETHIHFGKGQTSTELTLEPGAHTLRLQMADGAHIAQAGAQYQDEITVTVR